MARTTTARQLQLPDKQERELKHLSEIFEALIYKIKTRHAIIREKLSQHLARERVKNCNTNNSIACGLIAILDAIYDGFNVPAERDELIAELNFYLEILLKKIKKYPHQREGLTDSARYAFTHYFRRVIRKQENLPDGFLMWFEDYVFKQQVDNIFGEGFDFNRWKTIDVTDLQQTQRNFDEYPKKKWLSHINPFVFYRRESSDEELDPVFENTDETDSQFTIANVHRHSLALLYFLIEYNVLKIKEEDYYKLRDICRAGSEQEQVATFNAMFPDLEELILGRPLIRILSNSEDDQQVGALAQLIQKKLREKKLQIHEVKSVIGTSIEDPNGVERVLLYTSDLKTLLAKPQLYKDYINKNLLVKKSTYRLNFFYIATETVASIAVQATNFATPPNANLAAGEPYAVHRIIKTEHHHFELIKTASIRLLEGYLSAVHVGVDRLNNAMWLIDQIQKLPTNGPSSYIEFQRRLNFAKKTALEWDAEIDKHRFSFFRRNRFGSRYIKLLDDLRERALYCQSQENRAKFKSAELADARELKEQLGARIDDDHATHYLAEQVAHKEAFIEHTFKM